MQKGVIILEKIPGSTVWKPFLKTESGLPPVIPSHVIVEKNPSTFNRNIPRPYDALCRYHYFPCRLEWHEV